MEPSWPVRPFRRMRATRLSSVPRTVAFLVLMSGVLNAVMAPGAFAQVIRGQVIDSTTDLPVGTGFVVLVDSGGAEVTRALSTAEGWFILWAPRAGHYRLRSERIGYGAFVSQQFALRSDTTIDLRVAALPVRLAAVRVLGEEDCRVNPERAAATMVVWEEIRKALAATAWSETEKRLRYRMYGYERELPPDRRRVMKETGRLTEGPARQPYRSRDAATLADEGYIVSRNDGTWYYLPDAYTLLDEAFLGTHCFRAVRDAASHPGLVGLAFEPTRHQDVSDVTGILWLDEVTSELRTLEVGYTRVPGNLVDDRVGGTVEFMRLPSGMWIVDRWVIRAPAITLHRTPGDLDRTRAVITGFTDTGGEVLEVSTADGQIIYEAMLANVTGTVFDSTKLRPLANARVLIQGTDFGTVSDSNGRFRLGVPLEGEFAVTFSHVRLDSIGFRPEPEPVRLTRGTDRTVALAVPPIETIVSRLCPGEAGSEEGRVGLAGLSRTFGWRAVVGVVRSEAPVSRTRVTASWQMAATSNERVYVRDVEKVAFTDDSGFYTLCGLPAGRPLTLTAERGRMVSRSADVMFPEQLGGTLLMAWDRRLGDPYTQSYTAPYPVWQVDLMLTERTAPPTQIRRPNFSGVVTDRVTGQPIAGVAVTLNGTQASITRDDGTFQVANLELRSGANEVAFNHVGYEPLVQEIWIEEGQDDIALGVTLQPVPDHMRDSAVDGDPVSASNLVPQGL